MNDKDDYVKFTESHLTYEDWTIVDMPGNGMCAFYAIWSAVIKNGIVTYDGQSDSVFSHFYKCKEAWRGKYGGEGVSVNLLVTLVSNMTTENDLFITPKRLCELMQANKVKNRMYFVLHKGHVTVAFNRRFKCFIQPDRFYEVMYQAVQLDSDKDIPVIFPKEKIVERIVEKEVIRNVHKPHEPPTKKMQKRYNNFAAMIRQGIVPKGLSDSVDLEELKNCALYAYLIKKKDKPRAHFEVTTKRGWQVLTDISKKNYNKKFYEKKEPKEIDIYEANFHMYGYKIGSSRKKWSVMQDFVKMQEDEENTTRSRYENIETYASFLDSLEDYDPVERLRMLNAENVKLSLKKDIMYNEKTKMQFMLSDLINR